MSGNLVVVAETGDGPFIERIQAGGHSFLADEPPEAGGNGQGPDPYDLLLAALGACTAMTVRLYARRKGWPLQHVEVKLRHNRIHAEDCASCETEKGLVDVVVREVLVEGDLTDEQRRRLLDIAEHCPIHKTLTGEVKITTNLVDKPAV